jgi:hypothetical protein
VTRAKPITSYIYVARCQNRYKIGHSIDPEKRMLGLSTGASHAIELVLALAIATDRVRAAEKRAHGYLSKYHVAGEWFEAPESVVLREVKRAVLVTYRAQRPWEDDRGLVKSIVYSKGYL